MLLPRTQVKMLQHVVAWLEYVRKATYTEEDLRILAERAERVVRCLDATFVQTSNLQLVKIHMLTHYLPSIRRAGQLNQYSAQMWEHSHIWTVKRPYRRSNRRGAIQQVFAYHRRREAEQQHHLFGFLHRQRRQNMTLKRKAACSESNELSTTVAYCGTLHLPTSQLTFRPAAEEKYVELLALFLEVEDTICTQVKEVVHELNLVVPETLQINFHEAMEVAGGSDVRHTSESMTARASPWFFNGPYFSNIAIQAEDAGEAPRDEYGKVLSFISFRASSVEGPGTAVYRFALVKYYAVCNVGQVGTVRNPFPVLKWWGTTDLVDIRNVLRLVHVMYRFSCAGTSRFHLNMDKCY